jgi:hypothetical protein
MASQYTEVVEVFKTNVQKDEQARQLVKKLLTHFPHCKINFDLQDCDRILRVAGKQISPDKVIELINTSGYQCEILL